MGTPEFAKELCAVDARFRSTGGGIVEPLAGWRAREPDTELLLSTGDATGAWITLLVCKRHGVKTFRGKRMRSSTVGVRAPRGFIDSVLQPHIAALLDVFTRAKTLVVNDLTDAWLGPEDADATLFVDEER